MFSLLLLPLVSLWSVRNFCYCCRFWCCRCCDCHFWCPYVLLPLHVATGLSPNLPITITGIACFAPLNLFSLKLLLVELICHQLDYINIRGKECYNCNVWATQTNNQAFTINAHRGDQSNGCNFKSGSKVSNENIFGVYKAKDPGTHACAAGANVKTQYWFGGRL